MDEEKLAQELYEKAKLHEKKIKPGKKTQLKNLK